MENDIDYLFGQMEVAKALLQDPTKYTLQKKISEEYSQYKLLNDIGLRNKVMDLINTGAITLPQLKKYTKYFNLPVIGTLRELVDNLKNEINACGVRKVLIPTKYQLFLREYFKSYRNKGILLYHGVGSGKTFSSILMAIECIRLKKYKRVYVLLPAALKNNYISHITEFKDKFELISYNSSTMTKWNPLDLDESLVIIDEAQNLISMITNRSKIGIHLYNKLQNSRCNIIAMTATPMINSTYEYAVLFNLLRPGSFVLDVGKFNTKYHDILSDINVKKEFYKAIRGLVSYYQGANETSEYYPKQNINMISLTMNPTQSIEYNKVRDIELKRSKIPKNPMTKSKISYNNYTSSNDIKDPETYMVHSRQATNYISCSNNDLYTNTAEYSIKFDYILEKIKVSKGPVVVYSSFITNCLEKFEDLLRYNKISSLKWMGGQTPIEKEYILKNFNADENKDGSKCKVLLLGISGAEGISLKNVRELHIMEPYWNEMKIKQIIGRASRLCSHYTLPKESQNVEIYRYLTRTNKNQETVDYNMYKIAQRKYDSNIAFDNIIKQSALDCILNIELNTDVKECIETEFTII
jgi:hypothetical protein